MNNSKKRYSFTEYGRLYSYLVTEGEMGKKYKIFTLKQEELNNKYRGYYKQLKDVIF